MADKASADRVAADMQPPNFRSAVKIIRVAIVAKKKKIGELNKGIADEMAKVEGFKVNKKAGRIFGTLDALEHEERVEIMRSLNGLIEAAGWEETAGDLMDQAQNNVVHLRVGGAQAPTDGDRESEEEEDEDGDLEGAGGEKDMQDLEQALEAPAKPRRGRKPSIATTSIDTPSRGKRAFGEPDPNVQPYTGDNTDLAGE